MLMLLFNSVLDVYVYLLYHFTMLLRVLIVVILLF